jgi:hypothetical protein
MRLFLQHIYHLGKADTTGAVFRRVLATLDPEPLVEFSFMEGPIDRAIKKFPELSKLRVSVQRIENLDARFADAVPGTSVVRCSSDTLAAIADGIPKRLPFHYATFYFPEVSWIGTRLPDPMPEPSTNGWSSQFPHLRGPPVTGILLTSHWGSSRRDVQVRATVPVAVPEVNSPGGPSLPRDITLRLGAFGSFKPPVLQVQLDASEADAESARRSDSLVAAWKAALPALIERLPHALPPSPEGLPRASGLTAPHKPALVRVFRPRGWRYAAHESGAGTFVLSKLSAAGNHLCLMLDVGSWSHHCTCKLAVSGLGWRNVFPVEFAPGPRAHQYPVMNEEAWAKIVENIAFVVDHLERTALAEVEAQHPPAPRWLSSVSVD